MKTLKIKSCLDCPHHGIEPDPSGRDSFDSWDTALVCKRAAPSAAEVAQRLRHGTPPGRIIVGASRNPEAEYVAEKSRILAWCPL